MKKVAVAVPIYKSEISADEQISLNHLRNFLGGYEIFYAAPRGLRIDYFKFPFVYFSPKYFKDQTAYSRLLTSKVFFESFKDYEFVLIYQLDCLVFSDKLLQWCAKGYDYVGAPWLAGHNISGYTSTNDAVGNGGFSLRKVSAALEVLENAGKFWLALARILKAGAKFYEPSTPKDYLKNVREEWRHSPFSRYVTFEDYFWSFEAKIFKPDFKIPTAQEALSFSFEDEPRYCFERNHNQLPFGCHAWAKWDRGFWGQYLVNNK